MPDLPEYLTYFVAYAVYQAGLAAGSFHSVSQFLGEFQVGTLPVLLAISRLLSVLSGSLSVIAVYYIGRSIFNPRIGLTAAAIVSVSYYHLAWSKIGMYDAHATLFTLLSFYYSFRILTKGAKKDYILAGLLAGFATASKYSGVFSAIPIVAGHLLRASSAGQCFSFSRIAWSIGTAVVAFLLAVPYFLRDIPGVLDAYDLLMVSQRGFVVPFGLEAFSKFWHRTLTTNLGEGFRESFVAGAILILVRRRREELLVLSLPLLFVVANFRTLPGNYSYMFQAVVPVAALVSAFFIDYAVGFFLETVMSRWKTGHRWFGSERARNFAATGLLVLLMVSPATDSIRYVYWLGGTPIGELMTDWIDTYLPSGSSILWMTAGRPDPEKFTVTGVDKQDITEGFYESALEKYDYVLISNMPPRHWTWGRLASDAVLVKEIVTSQYHNPVFQGATHLRLYAPLKRSLHPLKDFVHTTGIAMGDTGDGKKFYDNFIAAGMTPEAATTATASQRWRLPINGEVSAPFVVPPGPCSISFTASLAPGAGMPIKVLISLGTVVVGDVLVNSKEKESFTFSVKAPDSPERIRIRAMLPAAPAGQYWHVHTSRFDETRGDQISSPPHNSEHTVGPHLPPANGLQEIRQIMVDGKQMGEIRVYSNGEVNVNADRSLDRALIHAKSGERHTFMVEPIDAERLEAYISPCIDFYGVEILAAGSRE